MVTVLYTTPSSFSGSTASLGRNKCVPTVVSSCRCRQRRSGSDNPLVFGRAAVGSISVVGFLLDAC